jgi:hypothetical protein
MRVFFFIALIALAAYSSDNREDDPRKVVGIEFKQNFRSSGLLQNNIFYDVQTVKLIFILYFR